MVDPHPSRRIEAVSSDDRSWLIVCSENDGLAARLVCTYLEAENIQVRVAERDGRFCVEVPEESLEAAMRVYGGDEFSQDESAPILQEVSRPTSVKTARRMREALAARGIAVAAPAPGVQPQKSRLGMLVLVFVITLVIAAALVGLVTLLTRPT